MESGGGKNHVMLLRSAMPADKAAAGAKVAAEQMHMEMMDTIKVEGPISTRTATMTATAGSPQQPVFVRTEGAQMAMPLDKGAATEDLGHQVVNGVLARGTRTTITIPRPDRQ